MDNIKSKTCKKCNQTFYIKNREGQKKFAKKLFCSKECAGVGFKDKVGQKFGRLTVLSIDSRRGSFKHIYWLCKCNCGNKKAIASSSLTTGATKSCGCFCVEVSTKRVTTHGFKHTSFYNIYCSVKARCENTNNTAYTSYGGRGIKCEWKVFEEFRDDMYESYQLHVKEFGKKETTVDRIDNNGNYCKENCRWATLKEQAQNKRNNLIFEINGEKQCLKEWSRRYNIRYVPVWKRVRLRGWDIKKALTTPVKS